ncbi:hypothetical protein D3C72_2193690 [compost metagenome]
MLRVQHALALGDLRRQGHGFLAIDGLALGRRQLLVGRLGGGAQQALAGEILVQLEVLAGTELRTRLHAATASLRCSIFVQ